MKIGHLPYERIRSMRVDRDLTQGEISKYLHVAQNTYSQYEIGHRQYPVEVIIRLAQFYNTSVDYLLGLTDEKVPYPKGKGQ